jgi:hypothetical protein
MGRTNLHPFAVFRFDPAVIGAPAREDERVRALPNGALVTGCHMRSV